jgi:D-alanyl-D-alanine carboxypeptidase
MTDSTFTYSPAQSGQFAHPYDKTANGALTDQFTPGVGLSSDYWGPVWTDGGLASTALDLARFGGALFRDKLVSAATLKTMTVMGPNYYGLGIYAQSYDGHTWDGHDGAYGGYESEDWTDPSRDVTITVTTDAMEPENAADSDSDIIWEHVVKAYDASFHPPACPGA